MSGQSSINRDGDTYPPIMDQLQASRYLNLSTKTLYNLRRSGQLAYFKFGDALRFHRTDLDLKQARFLARSSYL